MFRIYGIVTGIVGVLGVLSSLSASTHREGEFQPPQGATVRQILSSIHAEVPQEQCSYISKPPQGATVHQILQHLNSPALENSATDVDMTSPQTPSGMDEQFVALDLETVLGVLFSQGANGRRLGFLMNLSMYGR